jgi:hypothetical protein
VFAAEQDAAAGDGHLPGDGVDKGRLAGAIGANQA